MNQKTQARPQTFRVRLSPLAIAAATLFSAAPLGAARAQEAPPNSSAEQPAAAAEATEIVVTATRRETSIQDIPLNVSAITGADIDQRGLTNLADLTRSTPGLSLADQGGRDANLLAVRGLNANSMGPGEFVGVDGGGSVAQYLGDLPYFVDLPLLDLQRVEILLGPQGTLYGAGTLGGAIRYLPNRPKFGENSLTVDAGAYLMAHSDNLGSDSSVTANLSLGDSTAVRATIGYQRLPGFIDSPYLVRVPGVSNPDPDFSDPADVRANLRNQDDVNRGDIVAGRFGVRHNVADKLDANLTYYYQKQRAGSRSINHTDSFDTGKYENASRFTEPNTRRDQLGALELKLDLGVAELTSATGYSLHDEDGGRDQTDLLLDFEFGDLYGFPGYEDFPSFSAFTRETVNERRLSQELRLVSKGDSKLQWIVGAFYNRLHHTDDTSEFVPGYPAYAGIPSDNDLEYYQPTKEHLREVAGFGEIGYDFTPQWNVTVGGRYFKFRDRQTTGFALPLVDTPLTFDSIKVKDSDSIFKLNTSYKFTDDLLGYATLSEGYRVGGGNPVPICDDDPDSEQTVCGTEDERQFDPDKTLNHELGIHSRWLDGKLTVNGDIYYIRWKDAQVGSITALGQAPITINANKAASQGAELAVSATLSSHWSADFTYAYVDAKLKSDAPGILRSSTPDTPDVIFGDGKDGDRLPGSAKHQGNASVSWTNPLPENLTFDATYGLYAQSDVITTTGKRLNGESMGGYAVHFASASVGNDDWTVRLWGKNLFDKYAETSVRTDRSYIGTVTGTDPGVDGIPGNADDVDHNHRLRRYFHSVLAPMSFGLTYTYRFR